MADIVTDISVNKNWQARKGYHNPFTFTFTNNSSAFNISGYTFSLQVRRFGSTTNLINLTQGSGLTNGGATGVLTGQINAAATSSMSANEYYWQLTVVQPDTYSYVLFNGTFVLHDETYTGSLTSAVSVAVNLTGSDVDVTVTLVGGSFISFEDEGVSLGTAGTVDFVGAGVTATKSGDKVTVTIPGVAGVSGSGTTNQIAYWTGATSLGALTTATYPSLTELSYVKGITSSIQTQLDAKMPLSGTATFLGTLGIDADGYDFSVTNAGEISLAATTQISLTSGLNYFSSPLNQFTGGNVGLDNSAYINWGTTYGASGYGIRDNAGTMEFKNNAGSWTGFGSGGGGGTWGSITGTLSAQTDLQTTLDGKWALTGTSTLTGATDIVGSTSNILQHTFNSLGTTQTNGAGLWLRNTTAAAAGAQQYSPSLIFEGQGWKTNATAASQSVKWRMYAETIQGTANPTTRFYIGHSINGAAYSVATYFDQTSGGRLTIPAMITSSITANSGDNLLLYPGTSAASIQTFLHTPTGAGSFLFQTATEINKTSGDVGSINLLHGFAPASGTATYYGYNTSSTINMSGGANGAVSMFYSRPTVTAAGGDFYGFRHNPSVTSITGNHWAFYAGSGAYGTAANGYFNWGTTAGSSGYGIRDNSGVIQIKNSGGNWTQPETTDFTTYLEGSYTGGLQTVNTNVASYLSDGQIAYVELDCVLVQSSGTPGSTGIAFKLKGVFRKASGTVTQIGSTITDEAIATWNDTGDSYSAVPSLSVSGGDINFSQNLTTSKTLAYKYKVKTLIK